MTVLKRWIFWTLIACVAVLTPPALIVFSVVWSSIETERFYRERPLLSAIRPVYLDISKPYFARLDTARDVVLRHFPVGTEAATAIATLSHEGFHCQTLPSGWTNMRDTALQKYAEERRRQLGLEQALEPDLIDCQLSAPADVGSTWWGIRVQVEEHNRIKNVQVSIGAISF
jgi:hypothetical protein